MKFYNMCPTTGENTATAESLFQAADGALKKDKLNWSKCVSFGVDNCNTNMRCNNSMQTRLYENKNCFIAGCSCHLAHLAAGAGGRAFQKVSNFDVEDHQVDLYYYFKGSTRRKGILIEHLQFVGLEWEDMSRFVKTRWLCLERCCDKEQRKYPALKSLFTSRTESTLRQDKGNEDDDEKRTKKRFKRLKKAFVDPLTEVYISFFTSALQLFTHYNFFLQRSDPQTHNVHPMTQSLIKKIASRFLKREALSNVTVKNVQDESNYERYARRI